jgi:NAD(P)-dependent dehydrogenase (short-subunit alcohol dehydrogenase family)
LANILFTRELVRRFGDQGISAAAFHPGVVGSNFAHDAAGPMRLFYGIGWIKKWFMATSDEGGDQLVWLAQGTPGTDWVSGGYYEKRKLATSAAQANDAELAQRFWEVSQQLVAE